MEPVRKCGVALAVPGEAVYIDRQARRAGPVAVQRDGDLLRAAQHAIFGDLGDEEGDRDGDVLRRVEGADVNADLH